MNRCLEKLKAGLEDVLGVALLVNKISEPHGRGFIVEVTANRLKADASASTFDDALLDALMNLSDKALS